MPDFDRAVQKIVREFLEVLRGPHQLVLKAASGSNPTLGTRHRIRSTHCAREGPGSNGSPKYWVSRATLPSTNSMMLTV